MYTDVRNIQFYIFRHCYKSSLSPQIRVFDHQDIHWWAGWKIFVIHTTYISVKVLRPSFTNIKEKSSTWFLLFLYHWDCWCQKWRQWLWGIVCGCLVKDGRVIPPSLPRLMLHFPWLIDHKVSQQNAAAAHSVQLHTIHTLDIHTTSIDIR